jgi:multidrug efflux pump subunit AcrB
MNITKLAINNNRTSFVLFFILMLAGLQAFLDMPRAYDPGFIIRTAQVITYFPGANPTRVEQLVTDRLEKVVQEIPELDFVNSESRTGVSIISVNIKESYKDMRPIWDDLRRKIEDVTPDLPEGVANPIVNDDFGDVYGIVATLSGEGFSYAQLKDTADQVRDRFLHIEDVSKVDIVGEQEERIFVEYNNARLTELDLSPAQLSAILQARNILISGGSISQTDETIELQPSGNFETLEDIKHTLIQLPGSSQLVYLKDIADVTRGYVDPATVKTRYNGHEVLTIAISMREGGNNIRLGQEVIEAINELHANYPIGIDINLVNFSPFEVQQKVSSFVSNLAQAILVVAAVMLFTLGLRTGLIIILLIPASMLMSFLVMSYIDIGIDQISLAALIIALGMLVDNGIVMSESIMGRMRNGEAPMDAAISSAQELNLPLLTSSLTTAVAFLPIYLAESNVGEFTSSLFVVVSITLISSWFFSLTIIPLLCMIFLKVEPKADDYSTPLFKTYHLLLSWVLNHRIVSLGFIASLFFCSLLLLKFIPSVFFPPSDRSYFTVELEMPLATEIAKTESIVKDFEQYIESELKVNDGREQGVVDWIAYVGSGGVRFVLSHTPEPSSSNYALMIINVTDYRLINSMIEKINDYAFNHYPDLVIKSKKIESGAPVNNPVEVRISGDEEQLFKLVNQVRKKISSMDGTGQVSDDWGQQIKLLNVRINQARALRAGVSSEDVAVSLQAGLTGLKLSEFRENEDSIPIYLRSNSADFADLQRLNSLAIYAQATGKSVPLLQVADVEIVWQASKILRRDRIKTVILGAQLQPNVTSAEVFAELTPWLEEQQQNWPVGYSYELGGDAEASSKGNQSIAEKLPVAALLIIFLLVSQFNSLRKPLIILVTIPLGLIGVIWGLLIANSFFGFMTLLGIISLAGIVINNAIVLLERIKIELNNSANSDFENIIIAAQKRLTPILLTTATTVLGLIPLYLGGGEMWEPLAVSIMAGLLFSTLLTLIVVPLLYVVLFRVKTPA